MRRIFLLSPANLAGVRARHLLHPDASFVLAREFRERGVTVAEAFTFASSLYFRGKITYARHFARRERDEAIRVITSSAGLVEPDIRVSPAQLRAMGTVEISEDDPRFRAPFERDARRLRERLAEGGQVILLGSIATAKYRDVLLDCFGARLMFPSEFVGRGDMSRGALLLRAVRDDRELAYTQALGAVTRGKRAARVGTAK